MGTSKTELFTLDQNNIAKMAKAIGHPARVAIIEVLIEKGSCVCGEIVEELPLAQATISQHLRELKNAGILKGEIEGPSTCYCIDAAAWEELKTNMNQLFDAFDNGIRQCC